MEWQILQTIIYIVSFLATVVGFGVKLSSIIQKNTLAINSLTAKLDEMTKDNKKDHDHFHSSINHLEQKVAVLEERHDSDIKLLEQRTNNNNNKKRKD